MRIHYLQHVPFEGLGCISQWAGDQHHGLSATAMFAGEPLPDTAAFDFLIVMGGPMGVHDTAAHTWLTREKRFIDQALRAEKKVLGICLGAQLVADVLGARVYPNQHKEIGWHRVSRVAAIPASAPGQVLPDDFFALHWHGDTFDLPAGAVHLAQSDACRHQAFFYPPAALGLQFHLESTRESIDALIQHCGHELTPARHVQSEEEIRRHGELITPSNLSMHAILNFFQEIP